LQYWVVEHGHRAIIVFEGRDAAGKGGAIRRITERVGVCNRATSDTTGNGYKATKRRVRQ
jgi:polyphosphate kinase 2 (PPK2 family)